MKRNIIFIILTTLAVLADAQIYVKSTEQEFIEKAINNCLFITHQSFQVFSKQTGEIYGYNGKDEFGYTNSLGVAVKDGVILTDQAVRPWSYDKKFKKYSNDYDPIFMDSQYAVLNDSAKFKAFEYSSADLKILSDTTLYYFPSKTFNNIGFEIDNTAGEKQGWVIWVSPKKDSSDTNKVTYTCYQKSIKIGKEQAFEISLPNSANSAIGGVYIVPDFSVPSIIKFKLCGIIASRDDKWYINALCEDLGTQTNCDKESAESTDEVKDSELTPINKSKKKTKR
jgi:hypothetical protein